MTRSTFGYLAVPLLIGLLAHAPAHSQQPASPAMPPPPSHPAIEPGALDRLKAACQRLAGAKTMSFTAITT